MIPIPQDFQDFLRLLKKHDVEYLVIGGYAVAFHGYVRYTGDIDFYVSALKGNALKLVRVFREFGFASKDLNVDLFLEEGNIIRIGNEPMRLEVCNKIDGVSFGKCYENKIVSNIEGLEIKFISMSDLIKNKKSTRRKKDKADAEELLKLKRERHPL